MAGRKLPPTPEKLERLAEHSVELTTVEFEGQVIGFAKLYNGEAGAFVFIGNVIVDSALRGRGIGRELMKHMMGLCRDYAPEARLSVFAENRPAIMLYLSRGFRPYDAVVRKNLSGQDVAQLEISVRLD